MNDKEIEAKEERPVEESRLTRDGVVAVIYSISGVLLIALQVLARFRVLGMLIGVALCIWGAICIKSKNQIDRKPGAVIVAAGVLTILSKTGIPPLQIVSGTLLSMGAFGLLAMGIVSGVRFLIGLKKRS
ncbi:MAG: hypothetical protein FWG66_09110 [Spirochaetes bacterium]|nr:hypothetical protein [Spirochaetota bacterium]